GQSPRNDLTYRRAGQGTLPVACHRVFCGRRGGTAHHPGRDSALAWDQHHRQENVRPAASQTTRTFPPGRTTALNRLLLIILTLLICALPSLAQQPIALTHVTVIDGTGARPRPDQTVLIIGERITRVGKTGTLTLSAGTQIIDATGKF